jgi:AcrR family transcriptional regulator
MHKKEAILAEAFNQFSEQGVAATKIDDIARVLKVSKKTIYSHFKTKVDLLADSCNWKLHAISVKAQQIVDQPVTVVEKFILYLELIANDVNGISLQMTRDVLKDSNRLMEVVNDYLKKAVYERFSSMMEQGREEGVISSSADIDASLVIYWETLSSFLYSRSGRHIPKEYKTDKALYKLLEDQLSIFFRGLLNEKGIKEFDRQLANHSKLNKLFG